MSAQFKLSRRDLLLSLPALSMARQALAQTGSTLKIRAFNHMTIAVSDPKRTVDFYQTLFGMPIQARQGAIAILRVGPGPQFMAVSALGAATTPSINHYCVTVEDFSVDRVLKVLADHGVTKAEANGGGLSGGPMKVRVRMRGPDAGGAAEGTPEMYVGDPAGIVIQLQHTKYGGGAGVLGDVLKLEPSPSKGLIALEDYSHFTIFEPDAPRSNKFFQDLFGMGYRSYQGPNAPTLAIGPSVEFMMIAGVGGGGRAGAPPAPPRPPSINHVSFTMKNFNVEAVQKALESVGIKPRAGNGPAGPMQHYISMRMEDRGGAKEGTPELYFTDPDGILIQIQDASYCGGGGYLGNVCPPL
jgi:catechol 2,3-dioxygenase-like lactoylglutathione lyase family enzyme